MHRDEGHRLCGRLSRGLYSPRKDEPEFATTEMLYIHPDECIDCGACVPACPVEAIFALDETPDKWKEFIPTNAEYFQK